MFIKETAQEVVAVARENVVPMICFALLAVVCFTVFHFITPNHACPRQSRCVCPCHITK